MIASGIISTGLYVPPDKLTIDDFVMMGADRTTIEKWGILEHRVANTETATDMEAKAGLQAIARAGLEPNDIDLIIGTTTLAEKINPPNVMLTQYKIGAKNAGAFEVDMSCGGTIPALITADAFIKTGIYKNILIVGSCRSKRVIDYTDPAVFAVIGDGASAAVVKKINEGYGIQCSQLQSNGAHWNHTGVEIRSPKYPDKIEDDSQREYFYIDFDESASCSAANRYILESVPECVNKMLAGSGKCIDEIDWAIPHQNVLPIFGYWIKKLKIPKEKAIYTNYKYGNIGAANLFANLDQAIHDRKLNKDDSILFMGQGSGFAVGSILVKWHGEVNKFE